MSKTGIFFPNSIVSIDLLPIEPIAGVHFIKGDFMEASMQRQLSEYINNRKVDIVMSDIAPNFSGNPSIDHLKQVKLIWNEYQIDMCESVIDFARLVAKQDCTLILKVLQGSEFQSFIATCKQTFQQVYLIKPKASRKESIETYCILKSFKKWPVF